MLTMVVALLIHLDDHDVDVDANVESISSDQTCCRRCRCHILMSNFVVDNVVQLVVLLLDVLHHVDVEFVVLNCCNPFLSLHLGDAHSGCCTLLMPIPDVAPC